MTVYTKDPQATLDYAFDWATGPNGQPGWLADTETITSHTVTAATGLTLVSSAEDTGVVTAWLSGGTVDELYNVTCHIMTSMGRIDDRSILVRVVQR